MRPHALSTEMPSKGDFVVEWVAKKGLTDPTTTELLSEYESVWTTGGMKKPAILPFGAQSHVPEPPSK
jgi:hypothetical protein